MYSKNWKLGFFLFLPLFLIISTIAGAQENFQLQAPIEKDFVASETYDSNLHPSDRLALEKGIQIPQLSKTAASFSWFVAGKEGKIENYPEIYSKESKEYWIQVKGRQLKAGVSLSLSATGALVRINPNSSSLKKPATGSINIDPLQLELIDPNGKSHGQGKGMDGMIKAEDLQAGGSPFPAGTSAFKVKSELGIGSFKIKTSQEVNEGEDYLISVLEKQSDEVLTVQMGSPAYQYGHSLLVKASYKQAGKAKIANSMKATLRSPGGNSYRLQMIRSQSDEYQGKLPLSFQKEAIGELWEVEVSMVHRSDTKEVRRMGKTGFAYSLPTAHLLEEVSINRQQLKKGGLSAKFNLDVAVEGRYELRAMLYATDSLGELQPAVVSHSANWLEAGQQGLKLFFPLQKARQSGLGAPFEIRGLSLIDQKQLGLLHHQAMGIRIE